MKSDEILDLYIVLPRYKNLSQTLLEYLIILFLKYRKTTVVSNIHFPKWRIAF